jgi:uncharacterized protein YidB (DUF937 family)
MVFLESVIGDVLTSLLGGGMSAQGTGQNQGQALGQGQGMTGGLGGLMASFEQAGLGYIAQSWVGNGPNQPVWPQQLLSVLANTQV